MTFAIIKTGGKQYKVTQGDTITVEKLTAKDGKVVFDQVLLTDKDGATKVGQPLVAGASVSAEVVAEGKGEKKMVFRYKHKTRERKKKGHRQWFTKVKISKISA